MTYLLRDVPDDLWRKVKAKAALRGQSLRDVLIQALTAYLKA
jgi:plasmid stability protein